MRVFLCLDISASMNCLAGPDQKGTCWEQLVETVRQLQPGLSDHDVTTIFFGGGGMEVCHTFPSFLGSRVLGGKSRFTPAWKWIQNQEPGLVIVLSDGLVPDKERRGHWIRMGVLGKGSFFTIEQVRTLLSPPSS